MTPEAARYREDLIGELVAQIDIHIGVQKERGPRGLPLEPHNVRRAVLSVCVDTADRLNYTTAPEVHV